MKGAYPAVLVANEKCWPVWGQCCCLLYPLDSAGFIITKISAYNRVIFCFSEVVGCISSRVLLHTSPEVYLIRLCGKDQKILRLEVLTLSLCAVLGARILKRH